MRPLSKQAGRLLAVLADVAAVGRPDPIDEEMIIVSRARSGLSVSAGRFPLAAALDLERHDLAAWKQVRQAFGKVFGITRAGRAYLRRKAAGNEDPFRAQHDPIATAVVKTSDGPDQVRFNTEESPLAWLHRRKDRNGIPIIDEASYEAGERLRRDITLAGLLPGVTVRWGLPRVDGQPVSDSATDSMIAARQRLRHAFDAIGAEFSDLLIDLCGFLKGLEQIERERQWPLRSAKVVIGLALARLAEHYGLEPAARGPVASRGVRAWQAIVIEGGRP